MASALARRVAMLLAFVALGVAIAPVLAAKGAAASGEELRELRGRIEKLQADLASAEGNRGEAADLLKASGKAVSEAQRSLFELAQRRRTLEAQLAAIAARDREMRANVSEQEALAARLLRLQYRQGAPDRLRLALVRRNEGEQAEEARKLERERATRAAVLARLAGDVAKGRREIGRLKRDEARLSKLVEEIARALAAKPAEGKGAHGRAVERVADASSASRPFASLKGRLDLPVRGELMNRYGTPREETGATWKGLFIRSVAGETVHAVADGRVVYADWLRGFGNLLILDHGSRFMSLYANNDGLLRKVGESVRGGDPIAHVGASGDNVESGLYFELRRDGKPFDPLGWVAP